MSTFGVLAIKGDHSDNYSEILKELDYIDLNEDISFDNWDAFNQYFSDNFTKLTDEESLWKVFWTQNEWTIMFDPDLVDLFHTEDLSVKFNSEIYSFIIQTNSSTYRFSKTFNGNQVREFVVQENEIATNIGLSLKEEKGINMSETFDDEEIYELARKFNIEIDPELIQAKILLKNFDVESTNKTDDNKNEAGNTPWWKFW